MLVVEVFTASAITARSDIFPSLIGICQMHYKEHRHDHDHYLAGLWLNNLPDAMTWHHEKENRLTPSKVVDAAKAEYLAPSWLWATSLKPVTQLESVKGIVSSGTHVKLINWFDYELKLKTTNPYGKVEFASITYEGRLERMRFVEESEQTCYVGSHMNNDPGHKEPKEYSPDLFLLCEASKTVDILQFIFLFPFCNLQFTLFQGFKAYMGLLVVSFSISPIACSMFFLCAH